VRARSGRPSGTKVRPPARSVSLSSSGECLNGDGGIAVSDALRQARPGALAVTTAGSSWCSMCLEVVALGKATVHALESALHRQLSCCHGVLGALGTSKLRVA